MHSISALELVEWQVVEAIEPFGERRADWRAAVTTTKLLQVLGGKINVKELLADLMDVFEAAAPAAVDDEAVRLARIEAACRAWAQGSKKAG